MFKLKHLRRRKFSHKGENGRVLVVGGSDDYPGAVFLAGSAAYRSGVDNVTVVAPSKVAWVVNCLSPDFMTIKLNANEFRQGSVKRVVGLARSFDAVLIGNGIGTGKETKKFVVEIVRKIKVPKVIDADAIKAVSLKRVSNAIITPHGREFEALLRNSGCTEESFRECLGDNVLISKGRVDRVVSVKRTVVNGTGHEGMTVAGTGDVLAGLAAGILAQEKNLWKSAVAAAYVNGKIGERLSRKYGFGYVASDMLELIGKEVFKLID